MSVKAEGLGDGGPEGQLDEALSRKLSSSVAAFKVVSETLCPRTQSQMPDQVQVDLYAYYKQATLGPNTESPPNCLLSFISPPLTNVKWQTWRNLAAMSKAKAMKSFMEMYIDNDPSFLVSKICPAKSAASLIICPPHSLPPTLPRSPNPTLLHPDGHDFEWQKHAG